MYVQLSVPRGQRGRWALLWLHFHHWLHAPTLSCLHVYAVHLCCGLVCVCSTRSGLTQLTVVLYTASTQSPHNLHSTSTQLLHNLHTASTHPLHNLNRVLSLDNVHMVSLFLPTGWMYSGCAQSCNRFPDQSLPRIWRTPIIE